MPQITNRALPEGIYLWKIEETVAQLSPLVRLNEQETGRFATIKQPGKVAEKLAVRALLQNVARRLGTCSSTIDYTPQGRPTIHGGEISISHGAGYAALYLAPKPVGIDIESVGRKVDKLIDRVVSGSELEVCKSVFAANPLILAWCAKEAMFKALQSSEVDFVGELVIENAVSDRIFGSARGSKIELRWMVIEDDVIIVWSI